MSVPFERIGPGQIGRYAYQVIGKDGPIFNPTNISYIRPEDLTSSPIFDPRGALTGLAGISLAASVGTFAISAAVLAEVRQMRRQLDSIEGSLSEMSFALTDVQKRVQRIDTSVSELHLREALRHCLSSSMSDHNVDLNRLTPLIDDLQNLEETVEGGFLFNYGIRLSSDLRENLKLLLELLFGIRRYTVYQHNIAVALDPRRWIAHRGIDDYFSPGSSSDIIQIAITVGRADAAFNDFAEALGRAVQDQFLFAGDDDGERFKSLAVEQCYNEVLTRLHSMPVTSMGAVFSDVLDKLDFDYYSEDAFQIGTDIFDLWISETDAALLFRLQGELEGIRDGYANVFYPDLVEAEVTSFVCPVIGIASSSSNDH